MACAEIDLVDINHGFVTGICNLILPVQAPLEFHTTYGNLVLTKAMNLILHGSKATIQPTSTTPPTEMSWMI
jgi:putative copper export protein